MRFVDRRVVVPIIVRFEHKITKKQITMKIGDFYSKNMRSIIELAKKNKEYDKR